MDRKASSSKRAMSEVEIDELRSMFVNGLVRIQNLNGVVSNNDVNKNIFLI